MKATRSPNSQGRMGTEAPGKRIGFYGCVFLDRLVRVTEPADGNRPRVSVVSCPCGQPHRKQITWRLPRPGESLEGEVAL